MENGARSSAPPSRGPSDLLVGLLLGLVLAVIAIGIGMWALMGGGMMGGGMMGGAATGSGFFGLFLAVALLAAAVLLVGRALAGRQRLAPAVSPSPTHAVVAAATPQPSAGEPLSLRGSPFEPASASEVDALTLPLLDRDERLLYLEIRDRGRSALQKDLGHRDGFSRSKVTRTLDRLEAKGLVARERDGMTNRVRLTPRGGKGDR